MSDASRRALRTLFQFIASGGLVALTEAIVGGISDPVAVAAIWAFYNLLLAFAQNWLEDNTKLPAVLKAPPSRGVNPVPDPADDRG